MKVFLDANVLFSAALSAQGTAQALLFVAHTTGAQCVTSDYAFAEAQRNLLAKAPQALLTFDLIASLLTRVPEPAAAHVEAATQARVVPKDAPVLGAALQCRADVVATGDVRHFGHLFGQRVEGVLVLSLRAALDHLAAPAKPLRARTQPRPR